MDLYDPLQACVAQTTRQAIQGLASGFKVTRNRTCYAMVKETLVEAGMLLQTQGLAPEDVLLKKATRTYLPQQRQPSDESLM